jgi:methylated-DNA-[protein]-cysteine S-methyltransferase
MIHTVVGSPVGPLLLVSAHGSGLSGLYFAQHRHRPTDLGTESATPFAAAREQLAEYFAGRRLAFDLELEPIGTPFQRRVWDGLAGIGYGRTESYGQLARRIGAPAAVRAVGLANGRNPLSIVVACHRVVGSSGRLTGYAGGLDAKRWLLDHEAAVTGRQLSR